MIEALQLKDPSARLGDRLAGSGFSLASAERVAGASEAAQGAPRPVTPPSAQANPFDRQDLVEIRGNVRPLAADAQVALGAADEEGGGAPEGGQGDGGKPPAVPRRILEAYGASVPSAPALESIATQAPEVRPADPDALERRARQTAEAFSARTPGSGLGRLLDLAA